ncbi:MAG: alpha-galactosidase, partial [Bacteroidota bacterium]
MKTWCYLSLIALLSISCSVDKQENSASKMSFQKIEVINSDDCLWKYKAGKSSEEIAIAPPKFEVNGQTIAGVFQTVSVDCLEIDASGNMKAYTLLGNLKADTALYLKLIFHITENSPFVKFKYGLFSKANHKLTKSNGNDNLDYLTFKISDQYNAKELRLSDYSHKNHAYVPRLLELKESQFSNNDAVMGPIFIGGKPAQCFLIAYEHGSQYPNAYLKYRLDSTKKVTLSAIKGNYLNNKAIPENKPFETIWFQIGSIDGNEDELAKEYRQYMLKYQSPNTASRKPYVYYNTWGRQEREKWRGASYQGALNKVVIEKEIEIARQMGIDVFVIDVGWFDKAGAWNVNTTTFPDTLKQINWLLESKGMKLGLWYNPSITAVSSEVALNHQKWLVRKDGNIRGPFKVWETEESVNVCMVSEYWKYHADQMIALSKLTGSKYFKWDGIDFDICNDPHHLHGNESNTPQEREDSYGILMPIYMTKIA